VPPFGYADVRLTGRYVKAPFFLVRSDRLALRFLPPDVHFAPLMVQIAPWPQNYLAFRPVSAMCQAC